MKKKNLFALMGTLMMAMMSVGLASCGGDDDDAGSGGSGGGGATSTGQWYFTRNPYRPSLMQTYVEAASMNWETMKPDPSNAPSLSKTASETISGIQSCVIHILNGNTLQVLSDDYVAEYGSSTTGKQLLYRWNSPTYGTLGFYSSNPTTYTYDYYDDNKIYVYTWSKFFTIAGDALIMDGGRTFYQYNPDTEIVSVN